MNHNSTEIKCEIIIEDVDAATKAIIAHIACIAVGEASTCWSDVGKAGVFDSTKAKEVAEELMEQIIIEIKRERIEAMKNYLELGPEEVKRLLDVVAINKRKQ